MVEPVVVLRVRVRVRVRTIFERQSGDRTRVDGVCDFEKVPPDQLCRSVLRVRVRVRVRVRAGVRVMVRVRVRVRTIF